MGCKLDGTRVGNVCSHAARDWAEHPGRQPRAEAAGRQPGGGAAAQGGWGGAHPGGCASAGAAGGQNQPQERNPTYE
eukprot:1167176-Prorocentrum_minimum.AAC.1